MNPDEQVKSLLREVARDVSAAPSVPERTVRRAQRRRATRAAGGAALAAALVFGAAVVGRSAPWSDASRVSPAGPPSAGETRREPRPAAGPRDVMALPNFSPLDTGTYAIDPDDDPSTPLRVEYRIADGGWSQWLGAARFDKEGDHVAVSIATVTNLVRHGCRDHSPLDPPVGPTVGALATALADLAPFRVASPPADRVLAGYSGKHLKLVVPRYVRARRTGVDDLRFPRCEDGRLGSWIAPTSEGMFYGHRGPGYTEEFWILDVEGTRLVIVAHASADSPPEHLAEMRSILDSIRIQP